jgi:exosome complex exonuclease DIS3/RRP44
MDLMESQLFDVPLVLLQTVMEEVRHRSLPLYNRLKALLKTEEKRVWVFYNEFRTWVARAFFGRGVLTIVFAHAISETAVVREDDETPNDRNDRGA